MAASLYNTHGKMCTSKSGMWSSMEWPYMPDPEPPWTTLNNQVPSVKPIRPAAAASTPPVHIKPAGAADLEPVEFKPSRRKKKDDLQNPETILQCAPCRAVLAMDYDKDSVKEAALYIIRKGKKVTAGRLLDVIQKLEDDAQDSGSGMLFSDDEEEEETCKPSSDSEEDLYAPAAAASSDTIPRTCTAEARLDSGFGGGALQTPPYVAAAATVASQQAPPHEKTADTTSNEVDEALSTLKRENEKLRKATTCKICLDADVTTLFLPCRHLVCCQSCSDSVVDCPVCRERILGTVKTYMA